MRPISPHTRLLIEELLQPFGWLERLKVSRDTASILSEIGDSNEPSALTDILPFVLVPRHAVSTAAAMSVHKLVLGSTATELAWLDGAMRQRSSYSGDHFYEWYKLSPDKLDLLERFGDASVSLLGMATFHQSGYVREAALKRLDLIASAAELSFLVLRLNDWVSNVREAAYEAISSRLKPEYARHFIANLALVSRLEDTARADHKPLIFAINELLQGAECRTALLESLKSEDRFIRRASFRLALNLPEPDLPEVVRQGLDDKDTIIRLWTAQRISSAFEGTTLDNFLELMKRDQFMPVRREALRIAVRRNSSASLVELRAALLDPNTLMREEAHYHLHKLDQIDVADFYRQQLSGGVDRDLYAAISGLGETGASSDDHLIVPYASHPANRIRRAAIKALGKLNRGAHINLFIEALEDQVPSVSRQALYALADKASTVSGERVWNLFHSALHPHVKRNALSLIEKLGKWESIYYLLRAVRDPDEASAARSRFSIQRWLVAFNRNFSSPSPEQLKRLNNALRESSNLLDDSTVEQLRFSMRGFD